MSNLSVFSAQFDGQKVRVTDDNRFSVLDAIAAFTKVQNPRDGWKAVTDRHPEVVGRIYYFKFPGRGQRETPIATEEVLYEIFMTLPGARAAEFRQWAASILARYRKSDTTLATEIVEKSEDYDAIKCHQIRIQTKIERRAATNDLQAHGVTKFGMITNRLYQGLFDANAEQLRAKKDLPAKANVREAMSTDELTDTLFGERLLRKRIKDRNAKGDKECAKAAFDAGFAIRKLVEE